MISQYKCRTICIPMIPGSIMNKCLFVPIQKVMQDIYNIKMISHYECHTIDILVDICKQRVVLIIIIHVIDISLRRSHS